MSTYEDLLVLSIRREHAQRIFEGSKTFELRKSLPAQTFDRVYLCESGGRGIIGCFDVGRVLKERKEQLWDAVNYRATTKVRFESYFLDYVDGYAVEVLKPVRFKVSISVAELRELDSKFRAPMSSIRVKRTSPVGALLERRRRLSQRAQGPTVSLMPIAPKERSVYERLVLRYIGARYQGIDASFASRTLEVHDLGHDPAGFFTERKQVFSIRDGDKRVGFTTVTWKSNGCAKTGPTIIEKKYKKRGFGRATRRAIEGMVRDRGFRKVYCTCADDAPEVAAYLLDSGMKIEAHLDKQYSDLHGELVFGKFLVADEYHGSRVPKRVKERGSLLNLRLIDFLLLSKNFEALFSDAWMPVDKQFSERIIQAALKGGRPDPRTKAKRLVCVGTPESILGLVVLLPKRGGAVKALMCAGTVDIETIKMMIEETCRLSCAWESRKIYFLHPLLDEHIVRLLKQCHFQMEGFLRAPYRPGEDVGIFSRFC